MKPLESRKQLLIVESELNRAQLVQEWRVVKGEVRALTEQAKTIRFIATAAATLIAGFSSCQRTAAGPAAEKPSWLQSFVKGANLVSSLWQAFRPAEKNRPDKL